MNRRGAVKRKKLGQHFLADARVVERIVTAARVGEGDRVLEIGPGEGFMTRRLLEAGALVYAIELDQRLAAALSPLAERSGGRLTVERANALYFDESKPGAPYHIVSNLPYSVATALITRFVALHGRVASMTVMIQEEVARRVTAAPGDSNYGSLSVFVTYHADVEYLFTVPPEAFRPPPKVDSAVIRLIPRAARVEVDDEAEFFRFVAKAFSSRRKTLRNNVAKLCPSREDFESAREAAGIPAEARAQEISLAQFAALYARRG
ncbi:MAG: ribosomal RNA small subunit methyltransferase A [Nitrospinae bacterium]|nr:ribosomal RNA small subunit methyltransferase A [Nitrospinota bacterium]